MKRWTMFVALLLALVMVLSACGAGPAPTEGGETSQQTGESEKTEEKKKRKTLW